MQKAVYIPKKYQHLALERQASEADGFIWHNDKTSPQLKEERTRDMGIAATMVAIFTPIYLVSKGTTVSFKRKLGRHHVCATQETDTAVSISARKQA
jgi:hypothetical protein